MTSLFRRLLIAVRHSPLRALLLLVLAASATVAGLAYRRFADPLRVRSEAESLLQRFAHGRVRVGSATFSIFDGIHLFDVTVAEAPRDAPFQESSTSENKDPVFACRELLLYHDPASALWGRLKIRSVVAIEPTCLLIHDPAQGTTNIAGLFHGTPRMDRADEALPTVELRNARIRVMYREGDQQQMVDDLALTLRGRPSQWNPRLYDVVWQGSKDTVGSGYSQIDLSSGYLRNVHGGLPSLSIETVMLAVSAGYDGAGAWCDLLGLDGRVQARDYNLIGGMGADAPRSATIDLHDASLSIPIQVEERSVPADQRYLRFEHVAGTILVGTDAIQSEFTGKFHGSECKVSATMRGGVDKLATLDDVDFDAQLSLTGLELPRGDDEAPAEQLRFVHRFSQLKSFFRDYDPHGPVDLQIAAEKRAGASEPIIVRRVLVVARGGDASARKFPYRGKRLTGAIEYRPDGVWIQHVCGEHDGGKVCVDGHLERPDACAAAEITIQGVGLPIDDQLYDGLETRHRKIMDRLRPQGRLDVDIALRKPECHDGESAKYRSQTTVRFDDLSANYVQFPYPVNHLSGELRFQDDRVEIVGVEGNAGGAGIQVDGRIALDDSDLQGMEVTIVAKEAEFDERLLAALPAGIRTSVEALHPSGRFDVQTSLMVDAATGQVVPRSVVTLRGATVRPENFPVALTDISGLVQVEPSAIAFDGIVGQYRGAAISTSGLMKNNEAKGYFFSELAVGCRDLKIDEELRAAAPQKLREGLADWSVDGPIATDFHLRRDPTGDALTYSGTAELKGVNVRHARFPIPFERVQGILTFDGAGVHGAGFHGRYGGADVQVDFDAREEDDGEEGTIVLTATGLPLDGNVRELLPDRLRGGWDRAGPKGFVDVNCNPLRFRRTGGSPHTTWQVDGRIEFDQIDLPGIAGMEDLSGTMTGSGVFVDPLDGMTLAGALHARTARIHSRTFDDIASAWSLVRSVDGTGRFSLDETHAAIYGGAVAGHAQLSLTPAQTSYDLTATVHGMQIAPWLLAGQSGASASSAGASDDAPTQIRGTADAYLYLSGEFGDPLSRRGGGQLEVREGYIYRLPILLAILNVLDMSVPNDDALHELEADFFVLGNRLNLEEIALRGGSLNLVGSGTMSLPDQAVDLRLVNIGNRPWGRVPVLSDLVEGAAKEIMELRVTGPVSRPTVRAQPLRALTDELKRLFQKKPPKKIIRGGS